jgi:hypothetical protein
VDKPSSPAAQRPAFRPCRGGMINDFIDLSGRIAAAANDAIVMLHLR